MNRPPKAAELALERRVLALPITAAHAPGRRAFGQGGGRGRMQWSCTGCDYTTGYTPARVPTPASCSTATPETRPQR